MTFDRRHFLGATAGALAASLPLPGFAQAWPSRPIHLISPYGAGGPSDILTRLIGDYLAAKLGQSVVVENKAGAGTRIANDYVAHAPADGYTLLHAAAPISIGAALYKDLPYDVDKSFAPIVSTAIAPLFLIVNANAPYKTLAEFIQYGKNNPKGLSFGSPGAGSAPHLTIELFLRAANVKGVAIQYRGDAPSYIELLAGRIDGTLTAITAAMPHIRANKLRVLAVATEQRTTGEPQTPTFTELGLPSVVGYGWYGLMAPAGTPAPVLAQLNTLTNTALADAEIRNKIEALGLQTRGGTAAAFAAFIDSETRKWAQVIKAAHITVG